MSNVTQVLQDIQKGSEQSTDKLLPLVYEELRRLAAHKMANEMPGQTLQPTALVHEAYLRLMGSQSQKWQNPGHFFAAAAEAMRRILIENARRKSRLKRGNGQALMNIDDFELAETTPDDKLLLINDALARLEQEDPQKAKIVVLKFFSGLTNQDIAEISGVTERTIERQWAYAKAWLFDAIQNNRSG